MTDPRSTYRWQQVVKHAKATMPPYCTYPACQAPTRLIDLTLSGLHPWGFTLDHIVELEDGGSMWGGHNHTPMHRRCNVRKGNDARKRRKLETQRNRAHKIEQRTRQGMGTPPTPHPPTPPTAWAPTLAPTP